MQNSKDFFNRFSENTRHVLVTSQKIAESMKTGIGSEHILLALTVTSGNIAYEILKANSVNIDQIRLIIRFNNIRSVHGQGLSIEAKKILEAALEKAANLKNNLVEPEHLLWAILTNKECLANKIIDKIGVDTEKLTNQLKLILNTNSEIEEIFTKNLDEEIVYPTFHPQGDFIFLSNHPVQAIPKVGQNQHSNFHTPILDSFSTDLTNLAKKGKIDPVIGREKETARIIQILCRKTKNNPVLVGDPGVGKTAIVEGLAQKITNNNVPLKLQGKRIVQLDLSLVLAGTMYRGQFEERIKKILEEINKCDNVIIFIDEIHTIVGTGNAEGSMDAANILKPALAKGTLRLIGATTIDEYRKYIEKDSALERRMQPVKIEEPSVSDTIKILKGIKSRYEDFHKIIISNEALYEAVNLSKRYITDRYLPDKAIDLLDEASAAVHITSQINLNNEKIIILEQNLNKLQSEIEKEAENQNYEEAAKLKSKEIQLKLELKKLKDEILKNNTKPIVTATDIAKIVSLWSNIPMPNLINKEKSKILNLENILKQKVIGQDEAIESIVKAIKRSKAGISDPKRPLGAFIFLGPTGVGKTHLAKILAEELFGSDEAIIKLDMSEFMEKHNLSRLTGAPPGYVGYEDAGKLTEAIRRKPYSIILFDEIEKAHPDVFNILLQILEDGYLTDAKGKKVNFKNTIIIMTSNIGMQRLSQQARLGFKTKNQKELISLNKKYNEMKEEIIKELKNIFKPELINRIDKIIVFKPLDKNSIAKIVDLEIEFLKKRIKNTKIEIIIDKSVKNFIVETGFDSDYGARPIKRKIVDLIENPLSEKLLSGEFKENDKILILKKKDIIFKKIK